MKIVIQPLAKIFLIPIGLTAASSSADIDIKNLRLQIF